jgi:hypothetical protein
MLASERLLKGNVKEFSIKKEEEIQAQVQSREGMTRTRISQNRTIGMYNKVSGWYMSSGAKLWI